VQCPFCGETDERKMESHHLIPKFLTELFPELKGKGGTIILCANCHRLLHWLLKPIEDALVILHKEGK